jgi:drug/metabolite transporter (DMT)-like permease
MTTTVFFALLLAALLHAGWNAVVKLGLDRFSSMLVMALMQSGIALLLAPFFAPPARDAWPWLLLGSLLHTGYKLFLVRAYSHGDLSEVYPVSRGTAPLIVAAAGLLWLGEGMSWLRLAAIAAIAAGILLMAGGDKATAGERNLRALGWALGTACFTAAYTLADGVGARLAQSVSGFAVWLFVLDGLSMLAVGALTRGSAMLGSIAQAWRPGLAAGAMSLGSYWIAIWAFTEAPLALVAALRETSILFALLIGFFLLGERVSARRWFAAGLIVAGILLSRL